MRRVVGELSTTTWAYAAVGALFESGLLERLDTAKETRQLADETKLAEPLVRALLDVGVALGVIEMADGDTYTAVDGVLAFHASAPGRGQRLFVRSDFLQTSDVLKRAHAGTLEMGWHYTDPDILNAQGIGSGAVMETLCRDVVPTLDGLHERLSAQTAEFLDVGAGVGGICIALARLWPSLRIVGLEPAASPMAEAKSNIAASGYADRIEMRPITLEQLTDVERFDAGWLPQVFLPLEVLHRSIGPFLRSIKPGGWAIVFALSAAGAELGPAISRFRNVLWGGEPHPPDALASMLAGLGLEQVHTRPAGGGISGATLILGRKPQN